MKKRNVTISMPEGTADDLFSSVGSGKISKFVTDLIEKALAKKNRALREEYIDEANDPDIQELSKDFDSIDEGWE